MQCFLVGYHGTCHLSLVVSSYTHPPKGSCVYENTSDALHIPRYPTRKHCITSIYQLEITKMYEYQYLYNFPQTSNIQTKLISMYCQWFILLPCKMPVELVKWTAATGSAWGLLL